MGIFTNNDSDEYQDISVYNKKMQLTTERRRLAAKILFIMLVIIAILLFILCIYSMFDDNALGNAGNWYYKLD